MQFVRYGDLDGDAIVNTGDLPQFLNFWVQDDCGLDWDGDCILLHGDIRKPKSREVRLPIKGGNHVKKIDSYTAQNVDRLVHSSHIYTCHIC